MMQELVFRCFGCGALLPALSKDSFPFRCPRAGQNDDIDHLLCPEGWELPNFFPIEIEGNPFLLYRAFSIAYRVAIFQGLGDGQYQQIVKQLNDSIAQVEGRGFAITPFFRAHGLEQRLGHGGELWIKDETGNVSGSHKGRHLMGILLYLKVFSALGLEQFRYPGGAPALAIASCGNAALAAAVLAKAAGRRLSVFIPEGAEPRVVQRLGQLGADIHVCARVPGEAGDPCVLAFQKAVAQGAQPFCCQGNENGITIDGGKTIGFEIISMVLSGAAPMPETIFVQVGGGALASSLIQAFEDARRMGILQKMPRFCTVQTQGAFPLKRAYDRIVRKIESRLGLLNSSFGESPSGALKRADRICAQAPPALIEEELRGAASHRREFMFAWESEPKSIATGILDDETYDWLAIVRGMLLSGGIPIVATESSLARAGCVGREATGIDVDETGAAGLAGFLECKNDGIGEQFGRIALLFSGKRR